MPLKEQLAAEITGSRRATVWDRFFDPNSAIYQWTMLQQLWVELALTRVLDTQRDRCLALFDEHMTEKAAKKAFGFLKGRKVERRDKDIPWTHKFPIETVFKRQIMPSPIGRWLQKQDFASDAIRTISYVDYGPYRDVFMANLFESLKAGGDVAFAEFEIPIEFEMRDPITMRIAEDYVLQLSSHLSLHISDQIKAALIEGLRQGEAIPVIRDRVLAVWNKPIPIAVEPLIDPVTDEVLRRGYEYNLTAKNWASITARTEVLRWYNEGKLEGYRQTGVGYVQYTATDDHRTCPDCIAEHDQVYSTDDAAGMLPLHCRCRCTWRPVIGKPTELMFDIAVPEMGPEALALSYNIPKPGWSLADEAGIREMLSELFGIRLVEPPYIMKDLPPSALEESTPEQLEEMTEKAWRNAVAYYMMTVPPEDVQNPFEKGSLQAHVFALMLAVIGREDLETYVHKEMGHGDSDEGHYMTYEFIQDVVQKSCAQDVVVVRLRGGAYKIAGVRRVS